MPIAVIVNPSIKLDFNFHYNVYQFLWAVAAKSEMYLSVLCVPVLYL